MEPLVGSKNVGKLKLHGIVDKLGHSTPDTGRSPRNGGGGAKRSFRGVNDKKENRLSMVF